MAISAHRSSSIFASCATWLNEGILTLVNEVFRLSSILKCKGEIGMFTTNSLKSVSSAILIAVAAVVASVPSTRATVMDRTAFLSGLPILNADNGVELIRERRRARKGRKARRRARRHRRKMRRSRRYHRRRARRGHRRRHRHRRYRRGIYVRPYLYTIPYGYYYPYRSRRYYRSSRCRRWHRRCVRNWGYSNRNYRGCMRYHGCRPR